MLQFSYDLAVISTYTKHYSKKIKKNKNIATKTKREKKKFKRMHDKI